MTIIETAAKALSEAGVPCWRAAPLSAHGYWKLGGPADLLVHARSRDELSQIMDTGLPITVIGNGSNLLIADAGVRGITVQLHGDFRQSAVEGETLRAGGGVMNTVLLARMAKAQLGGIGCLAGVPGTLGGAIRMNAGTRLGEIGDRVQWVDVMTLDGLVHRLEPFEIGFSYRRATLPSGAIVIEVALRVSPDRFSEERAMMREHLQYRMRSQPLDQPSCGSVFKNPPNDHAGRLIEAAGLKGTVHGGAQISSKHANFIVNRGGATANDVTALIRQARDTVQARFGVTLVPEVHPIGDWPKGHWPL
jgi:UDP-N-acetylmuramate dehydrogenase